MFVDEVKTDDNDILIIDDQPDNLRLLSAMLTRQGYHVRKALSGRTALVAVQALLPDIILLDIKLPDLSGYEVCAELKRNAQTQSIPVVFISALDQTEDIVRAFAVGGADYVTKPFRVEEVLARIRHQLMIQYLQHQLAEQNQKLTQQNVQLQQEIYVRQQVEAALQCANQKLQQLVCLDGLTGVANRRHFDEYLQQEWQRSLLEQSALSLILCDLDFFKSFNDTYGHPAGDVCLRLVAQAIHRAVRKPNDMVFRYGGEEFAVVLPDTDGEGALQVARAIQHEVQQLKLTHDCSLASNIVTLSMGITSQIPNQDFSLEMLLAATDKSLYHAKQTGRNRYCITFPLETDVKNNCKRLAD